ncbi:hypothetical protein LCGC14_2726020 [marine sediment metagenome]|uniref:Uncharacterized protein n=1 Tax=marine sediment metagenome TaxID=412755 RepID=A0A0F8Z8N5_9ZZZZ
MTRFFRPWYKNAIKRKRQLCEPRCIRRRQEVVDGKAVTVRIFPPHATAAWNDTINHMTGRNKKAWKPTFIPD